ncbi:MAG: PDZ domain-containing protein [Candidatus Eisenbacteria bacterium]
MRPPWKLSTAIGLAALFALVISNPARSADARPGWLGVYTQSLNDGLRDGIGYNGDGVLVSGVEADSPADHAGIHKGDVIVSFNSRTVTSPSMLSDVVGAAKPGQSVSVAVWRHGTKQSLSVKVGERPADLDGSDRVRWDDDGDTPEPPTPPIPPRAPREPGMVWTDRDMRDLGRLSELSVMTRPRLGVQIQDLNRELGDYFGVTDGKGVLVTRVTDDTPASRAGMKAGDVIVKVGGTDIEDSGDLQDALRERAAGKVDVTVMRKGQRVTVSPELAEPQKAFLPTPMGSGWKKTGSGEWSFDSPDTHKHIVIHRSGDDDGDIHIITPRGDRHVIVRENLDGDDDASKTARDAEDRAEMQKQIDDLKQQVESLRGQLESSKTPSKSTTKTTTKGTGKSGDKTP